ncbi:MAG: hypothetical protein ACYCX3_11400 [Thermoleophilia bacterium]
MNDAPGTPDTTEATQSPNDLLAVEVADALVNAGLIIERHKAVLLTRLKSGGVRQDDWNLWVDMATAPEAPGEEVDDE